MNVTMGGWPRGYVAADKRLGGGLDAATERTRTLAPRVDDHGVVLSRTSSAEGRGAEARRRGCATRPTGRPREDVAVVAAGQPQGSAPQADGRGGVSPQTSGAEGRRSGAAATHGAPSWIGRRRGPVALAGSGIASRALVCTQPGTPCLTELPWGPGEAFGNAKARKEPRRRTKRQLGADAAAGREAAADALDAPRQQPSMHTHSNWQGDRRGGFVPTGGAGAGPASSE